MLAVLCSFWQTHKGVEFPAIIKDLLSVCSALCVQEKVLELRRKIRLGPFSQGVYMDAKMDDTVKL